MPANVFSGPDAVAQFLNPDNHMPPLVELPAHLNPFAGKKVRIFAKLMAFLPLANVKSLPAYSMLENAKKDGKLDKVHTLVESSSGNTVFSIGVIARAMYDIPRTVALSWHEIEPGKLQLLQLFGTDVMVIEEESCPDPADPNSGINIARKMGEVQGFFNPAQYHNQANPDAHERWTGPQLWEQTEGKISVFCAGLGTTGTLCGTGAYLRQKSDSIAYVGVVRLPENPVPGVRTETLLREIAFPWRDHIDQLVEAGTRASYKASLQLCSAGIMAGPSSGFALAGLLRFLKEHEDQGTLDSLRNVDGEVVAVFISPDSPLPYLEEYARFLGKEDLASVQGEYLLRYPAHGSAAGEHIPDFAEIKSASIDPADCLSRVYQTTANELSRKLEEGVADEDLLAADVVILDLRPENEFNDHHLPGSNSLPREMFLADLSRIAPRLRNMRNVVLVCAVGALSTDVALKIRNLGVPTVRSLHGGTVGWKGLGLPLSSRKP